MYNLCIGICICRGQCRSQQIFDKLQTADLRRYVFFTQKILQRNQIYRFAVIIKNARCGMLILLRGFCQMRTPGG